MKTYEIINPSDPYSFLAPDQQVATLVIVLLSPKFSGKCQETPDGSEDVPFFMFGGFEDWWARTFDCDVKETLEGRSGEVVEALRSTLYGRPDARQEFERLVADIPPGAARDTVRRNWNDERRTSLNDISAAAFQLADRIEASSASSSGAAG